MRFKYLAVGIAIVAALGMWQVRAEQDSRANQPDANANNLLKHGSYLVNEVAHCGDCHTPQDKKGMPDGARRLRGAPLTFQPKKGTENWAEMATDITSRGRAGEWSEEEMVKFLTTGLNPDGERPIPPMPVFHLNANDARAVYRYLSSLASPEVSGN
jgi:mono/diheme cytochrome c family protein